MEPCVLDARFYVRAPQQINLFVILHQYNFLFLSSWKRSRWRPSACSSCGTSWCRTWNQL